MTHSQYLAPYMTVRMMEVKNKLSWHMISTQEMFSRKYTAAANVCFLQFNNKVKDSKDFQLLPHDQCYNGTIKM